MHPQLPDEEHLFSEWPGFDHPDECVMCGECYLVCPQNCKIIRDDLPIAKPYWRTTAEVYVSSVAPSFLASFPR
jgi:ferredoxin